MNEETIITNDLDEFCNFYTSLYEVTDELYDTSSGVRWESQDGTLKGRLDYSTVDAIMDWIYIHLK